MRKLNIVTEKDKQQFELVSFVNGMTPYRLKVLIKRIWESFLHLANIIEDKGERKDIAFVIDQILSGEQWNDNDIKTGSHYFIHKGEIVKYDPFTTDMVVYGIFDNKLVEVNRIKSMTEKSLVKFLKECKEM